MGGESLVIPGGSQQVRDHHRASENPAKNESNPGKGCVALSLGSIVVEGGLTHTCMLVCSVAVTTSE